MQPSNLDSAWKQIKLMNSMQHIGSNEILSIIDGSENTDRSKLPRVLFNLVMFIAITIFVHGG